MCQQSGRRWLSHTPISATLGGGTEGKGEGEKVRRRGLKVSGRGLKVRGGPESKGEVPEGRESC